ncbi:MAG: PQQ-binding-like beta-propeller repeat protein [Planctomycetales bacterium]|nr:PQQ-binding-like beta-propeller repeat protein [Planctomycetales bacterium]
MSIRPEDLPTPLTLTDDDWPQFRGARRDGIVRGTTRLARSWPAEGPPVLWETTVGQGYAAPSIVGDRVFLNDYDEENGEWKVRCLSLETGEALWEYKDAKPIRPNHAITRSAPATDGGFVFAIDPKCDLHCLDARHGGLIWKKRLPALYESTIPAWYNGQCPLIDQDRLIVATGGRALIVALEKATGKPIWETPNPDSQLLSHSSVMPIEINGVRQYAYMTLTGLNGVSADTGELLWNFPWKFNTAVPTSPLYVDEGRFMLTSGYHAQSVVCQVMQADGAWTAKELTALASPPTGWNSEVHTPIYYRGHIYGIGKSKRGMWTCLDLEGHELWTSGSEATFGMGGYVLADGLFFALDGKSGTLRMIDAEADEYHQLGEAKLLAGPDVWAPPIVSGGKLIVRDLHRLLCLDVSDPGDSIAAKPATSP